MGGLGGKGRKEVGGDLGCVILLTLVLNFELLLNVLLSFKQIKYKYKIHVYAVNEIKSKNKNSAHCRQCYLCKINMALV